MKILEQKDWPDLPKWPGVFVTGKQVTPEQAKEIIFRTDTCVQFPTKFLGGNDHDFHEMCVKEFGWTEYLNGRGSSEQNPWELGQEWANEMGMIGTRYVYNTYLSSSYINGPTGWVHMDGTILVDGHNYGKWPSVQDIVQDWTDLVRAFPYLDLACTLHDGEACSSDSKRACTIVVRNGTVVVCEPDMSLHSSLPASREFINDEFDFSVLSARLSLMSNSYEHEQGWPREWIREFGVKSTEAMKKVISAHKI